MAQDPDLEFVQALKDGDESALVELMARHREPLFRFLYRYTRSETTARDIAQEAFVRAYFKIATFQPQAKFGTWLHHIALNLVRDHSRNKHVKREALREPWETAANTAASSTLSDPGLKAVRSEQLELAQAAIDDLPEELKAAFLLTVMEEMSQEEAGIVLGLSVKAVEARVYRARKLLRQSLFAD